MTHIAKPQSTAEMMVVASSLRPIKGRSGAPRQPDAGSASAIGRVPNGSTANSGRFC